jgi:hypothetical protein
VEVDIMDLPYSTLAEMTSLRSWAIVNIGAQYESRFHLALHGPEVKPMLRWDYSKSTWTNISEGRR